jgi:hypothetical protein
MGGGFAMSNDIQLISYPVPLPELTDEEILRERAAFLGESLDEKQDIQTEAPF